MDERDHLKIQISLEKDVRNPDHGRIAALSSRLSHVDALIAEKRRVF